MACFLALVRLAAALRSNRQLDSQEEDQNKLLSPCHFVYNPVPADLCKDPDDITAPGQLPGMALPLIPFQR